MQAAPTACRKAASERLSGNIEIPRVHPVVNLFPDQSEIRRNDSPSAITPSIGQARHRRPATRSVRGGMPRDLDWGA